MISYRIRSNAVNCFSVSAHIALLLVKDAKVKQTGLQNLLQCCRVLYKGEFAVS